MNKVYIAAAFRRFSNRDEADKAYGEITDWEYVNFLERIEEVFLNFGFHTCLPHRDEGLWGKLYYVPSAISALCLRHVHTSDVVFALAESGRGVHIELGYAAALGHKKIMMMYRQGTEPSTLIWGLSGSMTPWRSAADREDGVSITAYLDENDLLRKLQSALAEQHPNIRRGAVGIRRKKAIIDIGSHTLKFKVYSCAIGNQPRVIHEEKNSLGIMGDVLESGTFSAGTIEKLIDTILGWKEKAAEFNCEAVTVTGTAAIRKSANAAELAERIERSSSLRLEVIGPEKELEYVYSGVQRTFRPETALAVLNLGGGSTQVGIGSSGSPEHRIFLDFGTRELTQRYPWDAPMQVAVYRELLRHVRDRVAAQLGPNPPQVQRLVHTGGELDFMLRCQVPLTISEFSPIHVSEIKTEAFCAFSEAFAQMDPRQVTREFSLDSAWASGSVASNVIAHAVAEALHADAIIPSNLNIADGLLLTG